MHSDVPSRINPTTLAAVAERLAVYERVGVDETLAPGDDMFVPGEQARLAYLRAGRSAVDLFLEAMLLAERSAFPRILDLPCGFGRVTRHLVRLFPDSRIWASDLYPDRVDFCSRTFGVHGMLSKERFAELDFGERFDLIWVGSLLTHLPEPLFLEALECFRRHLSPNGIAIVSTHGRFSIEIQHRHWKYLPDERFAPAEEAFWRRGFGYAELADRGDFPLQASFGHAMVKPSFALGWLESCPELRLFRCGEATWDWHHDVLVFGRPGVLTQP